MPITLSWMIGIAAGYTLIFNVITTIRLLYDDYYQGWRNILMIGIIWLIPFLGALLVALFLNTVPLSLSGVWAEHPHLSRFLGRFLWIEIARKGYTGYPDSSNDYSLDVGSEWYDIGYEHPGEGGGDGGGE